MRAWFLDAYNGVENLRLGETPDPAPGPGQVLLRVRFAALNPADAFLAQAMYPARPHLPHVLGRDGVGEIVAAGPGVSNVNVGDTVAILRCDVGVEAWGTLAEKVVVAASGVVPVPAGWSLEQASGAALVYLTAWKALTQWSDPPAPLPAGSTLLVTGASGGVGTASVQLGKSMGFTLVALSRSPEKGAELRRMGADFVFNPTDPDLRKAVMAAIAPKRVDLVVDSVGGALFNQLIPLLEYRGRISAVGRSGGEVPSFNTAALFFRRTRIGGVAASDFTLEQAAAAWKEITGRLNGAGYRPVVDRIFGFEEVKQGFARLAEGPMGKVLVRVAG
jgi:NADPH:quinone reductase